MATGNLKGAVKGGIFAAVTFGIGHGFGGKFNGIGEPGSASRIFAHSVSAGVSAEVDGGKFGHGFASAFLSQHLGKGRIFDHKQVGKAAIVSNAILQGTISQATGGKFANGAMSAAFRVAFNDSIWEDIKSGKMRDQFTKGIKAELSIISGGLEIAAGANPVSGLAGGAFLAVHGVGTVSGGIGDYLNILDGGARDGNFVRQGYENLAEFAGADKSFGTRSFYAVDFAMGVGALTTPIKVPIVSGSIKHAPFIVGGFQRQMSVRATGALTTTRDVGITVDTLRSFVNDQKED